MKKKIATILLISMAGLLVVVWTAQKNHKKSSAVQQHTKEKTAVSETKSSGSADEKPLVDTAPALDSAVFKEIISDNFSRFEGNLSYSFRIYNSDCSFAQNETVPMKSASVIKLFIMDYAYSLMQKGEITQDTTINGSSLSSLIYSMITVSDNTATNTLIDYFTMPSLNEYFKDCGYTGTKLQRRMLDTAAAARGEENYTTAQDVMAFLDNLYMNKTEFPQKEMLDIMKKQQISTKLRRDMPVGVEMASKTGELSDTENDVAVVFSPKGDYSIVFLTGKGSASVAREAMAVSCREIYDTLQQETVAK